MIDPTSRRTFLRAAGLSVSGAALGNMLAACSTTSAPVIPTAQAARSAQANHISATSATAHATTPPPATASVLPEPATATSDERGFPQGFLWGVATSAYQIEGAAREDGRGESVWDRFSHTPGKTRGGATGDIACDHYHRYAQDLELMKALGIQTYRFSIAWPRIFPTGAGQVNQKGLDFYRRLIEGLLERGIRPMATLFHWDLPQALQDQGGWENRDISQRFAEYADTTFRALGDLVPAWLTLNEPKTVVLVGYIHGAHAPGLRSKSRAYRALHHMLLAHGLAVQAFRALGLTQGQQIGAALNLSPVYPAPGAQPDADAVRIQDGYENRLYLDPVLRGSYPADIVDAIDEPNFTSAIGPDDMQVIGTRSDFLGVNYYNPTYVRSGPQVVRGNHPYSAASWQEVYPEGMYDILVRLKRDYGDIPISITENGAPYQDTLGANSRIHDRERLTFFYEHLAALRRAIADGANVTSYHAWSLLDNFEWAEGYSQRWGIVYVDFDTQRRIPKDSALWYREVIAGNALRDIP